METFRAVQSAKGPSLFLLSPWLEQNEQLTAGFTGRDGGVSEAPWTSLNLALHVGDRDEDVVRNRSLLTEALDWPFEAWTCGEQVHGCEVQHIGPKDRGKGRLSRDSAIPDTDAIMTDVPGVLLASFYADCVPLYFYDPEHEAVALAHAGWKGTVLEIAAKTIQAMADRYGTKPEQVRAAIGPSIDACCYEVDGIVIDRLEELASRFAASETAAAADESLMKRMPNGKAMVNLKQFNRQIMIKAGILPIHIELSKWCTGCNREKFFSHRMEGGSTGRMASWIGIRER
ncbi:peptidoglycan editing factor PgeF [Paenibacillus radicis (ex Gao et al. 2016)]|uniref:Purine nucleoside phosphorylase n=1 Tax=Paenibacillus radicis (ex Gao et al. 2016) TaxID=1737354 RepID=A0A917MD99_9BACL|nr:peptidoglycan editing factor PgeF [Paenibacillus radicis (ex Gao et al. 2016)]GGG89914.1 laccase domain protein [Paenibacillus radicis (ex Gao et al. 2016)]